MLPLLSALTCVYTHPSPIFDGAWPPEKMHTNAGRRKRKEAGGGSVWGGGKRATTQGE